MHLTSFAEHLDEQYGKPGTIARDEFEEGFESFKFSVMLPQRQRSKKRPLSTYPLHKRTTTKTEIENEYCCKRKCF